jgi:GGDEF domain-containing protein
MHIGVQIAPANVVDRPLSFLKMDGDRFKRFDDRLGHAARD